MLLFKKNIRISEAHLLGTEVTVCKIHVNCLCIRKDQTLKINVNINFFPSYNTFEYEVLKHFFKH